MTRPDDRPSRRRFLVRGLSQISAAALLLAGGRRVARDWKGVRWQAPRAEVRETAAGEFCLRLGPGREYEVNETGMLIWQLCDGKSTGTDLVTALSVRAGISRQRAITDVRAFLVEMAREGLVKLA